LTDVPDNILFNGTNVNAQGGGKRFQMTVEPGKRYLMRFINTGVDDFYKVGIGQLGDAYTSCSFR
jgi:hypothetical protein